MNELDELVKLRRKNSLFSEHARTRARILLVEEISRRPPRRRCLFPPPSERLNAAMNAEKPARTPGARKIYYAAHTYMILGLISGLAYREITKIKHFTGETQLSVVHTHLLALGMLFFLIVLVLEKLFELSAHKLFGWFFWTYNAGLALTVAMMAVRGTQTALAADSGEGLALVAGLGHIVLTFGLIFFFVLLGKRLRSPSA